MAFKIFDAYGAASRPEATLRASGYLFLSKGILKRAGVEDATHAQLMFDEDEDRLGIKLLDSFGAAGESALREISSEKSGGSVNIMPLLRYHGFPDPKTLGKQVFPVTFEGGLVVIALKDLRTAKPEKRDSGKAAGGASEEFDDDIPF